ncbi:ABC transporter ATP-binding protein [Xanthomonas sp. MUS 060]|uniref:ABC transporter ATP-binding protein n=1 Tax=Xanthomonas sp. MUS 060 TaxID=1588031 RepID=UPI0005F2F018|nr:ABC transporter ATP-binding protein [Xanthomonas sp. MUS 060]
MTVAVVECAPVHVAGAAGAAPAVLASGLYKGYGRDAQYVQALMGVDLRIELGEIVGVLGPNGAGKTTLASILEGLVMPDAGSVSVLGHDVGTAEGMAKIKPALGISMQNSVLPPLLKVSELLAFKSALSARSRDASALIEALGLSEKRNALYRTLSGGQQQRVVVAMALIGDPAVMFLDEPTSQLDPQARCAVWDLLDRQRRERSASILVTTHQMEEAERLCDRVLIIDHGQVIATGRPRELVAQHCPQKRIEFLTDRPERVRMLEQEDGIEAHCAAPGSDGLSHVTVRGQVMTESLSAILELQRGGTMAIEDLRVSAQSLEDVFLKLTGRRIRE